MKCTRCDNRAVFLNPTLCRKHFIEYFEEKVKRTVSEFGLINKKDRVVVACSGGKDSTTVLYLLNRFHYNAEALAIDEGIAGYREHTLKDLKSFCKKNNTKLNIFSFKEEFGKTLDEMLKQGMRPCTICGTLRRYLLNKHSKKYDKIATGHNLDDESQAVLMNLTKSTVDLLSHSTPITPKIRGFVQRIKPLYFCSEKEVAAYSLLKEFVVGFVECPYVEEAYRNKVRRILNMYEEKYKGTKLNILKKHLQVMDGINNKTKKRFRQCSSCGEPSKNETCTACKTMTTFK